MKYLITTVVALFVLASTATALDDLQTAVPEHIGLSSKRLARIDRVMEGHVARGHFSGAIGLIARQGKIGYFKTWGDMDKDAGTKMPKGAIFRMYSMTKAIISVVNCNVTVLIDPT